VPSGLGRSTNSSISPYMRAFAFDDSGLGVMEDAIEEWRVSGVKLAFELAGRGRGVDDVEGGSETHRVSIQAYSVAKSNR
jgi:hypothetical protein